MATSKGKKQRDNDLEKPRSKEVKKSSTDVVFEKALKSREEKKQAKGGREDLKENIDNAKKRKRRKRRPKKPQKAEVQQPQQQPQQPKSQPQQKPKVQPINPFIQTSPQSSESYLPPKEHEERYQEELEPADEGDSPAQPQNVVDESKIQEQAEESPYKKAAPTIEKKALEDKPLDRITVEEPPKPKEEKKDPEKVRQAEEKISESSAEVETPKASEVTDAPKENEPVEAEAETVEVTSVPVQGHVEPDLDKMLKGVDDQNDEFKEDFWDILRQAGFTPKRIIYTLIFIVLGIFLIYNLIKWIIPDGNEAVVEVQESEVALESNEEQSNQEVPNYVLDSSAENGSSVVSSYVFGLEDQSQKDGINTIQEYADESGFEASSQYGHADETIDEEFAYYYSILSRIKNLYETDVYNLLDVSDDRSEALESFISEMEEAIEEAKEVYNSITEEMIELDTQFEEVALERDQMELNFFTYSDELRGQAALDSLEQFVESTTLAAEIRAYYNAHKLIRDKLFSFLGVVEPHLEEIKINKQAVVKGIRVFDIPGTDETEIIVPVNPE